MPEVVGVIKCPICGAEGQELRVNKNHKLYVFCDRGCSSKFNSQKSREWLARLARGDTIFEQNYKISPLKSTIDGAQIIENQQQKGVIENGKPGRIDTIGRTNAGLAGDTERRIQPTPSRRGWLSDFFINDDEREQ